MDMLLFFINVYLGYTLSVILVFYYSLLTGY